MNTNCIWSFLNNPKECYSEKESRVIFGDGGDVLDKTNVVVENKDKDREIKDVQMEVSKACNFLSSNVDNQIDDGNFADYIIKKFPNYGFVKGNLVAKLSNAKYKKAMIAKFGCPNPAESTSNASGYSYTVTPGNLNDINPNTSYYYYGTDEMSSIHTNNNQTNTLENSIITNDNEETKNQKALDSMKKTFSKGGKFENEAAKFDIRIENIAIHNGVIFVPIGDMDISKGKKPKATLLIANKDTTIEGINISKGFSLLPLKKNKPIIFLGDNPTDAFNHTNLQKYKVSTEKKSDVVEPEVEILDISQSTVFKGKEKKDDGVSPPSVDDKKETDALVSINESVPIDNIELKSTHTAIQALVKEIKNASSNSVKASTIQRAIGILQGLEGDNTKDIDTLNNALVALLK